MSARAYTPKGVPAPLAQLPNALTMARLALVPVFVVVLAAADGGHSWPAAVIFGVAGVTDQVDGFLARRWRVESRFGAVFDPLADRLMIDAAIIVLTVDRRLPWAALAIIVFRDGVLALGGRYLAKRGVELSVNTLGKAGTWLLYAGIGFRIAFHDDTHWPLYLFWIGLALALLAAVIYMRTAWKALPR
jgi:CDP-diacylglycerol--glycerol-3-phosphate 3-phosphatidyltransferase